MDIVSPLNEGGTVAARDSANAGAAEMLAPLDALTCDACFKPFHTLPDLKRHLRSHAKRITNRPSPCPYCKLRFALRSHERRAHIERCHPAVLSCANCDYRARSLLDMQEHVEARHLVHERVRREFLCALCPGRKAYLKRRSMREHFQRRHLKLNVCQHCGRAHGSPAALLVHERLHTGERPYVCEMCGRAYHNASSLNMHKHSHHRGETLRRPPVDRLQCQLCNERFLTLEAVRSHLEASHGIAKDASRDRGFECEVCRKRFTALQTMRDHMLLHRGERPHECHVCRKRFTTRSVRNKHVLVVHQGVDERRFACSACGKRFVNRHKLTVHERLHTGERPFSCEICAKTYTNASRVKEHKMAVHKIMPYRCDECGTEFKVGSELRLHQLVHSQQQQAPPPPQLQVRWWFGRPPKVVVKEEVTGVPLPPLRPQRRSAKSAMRSISKFAKMAVRVETELQAFKTTGPAAVPSSDEEVAPDFRRESCRYCKLYVGTDKAEMEVHLKKRHPEKVTCHLCQEVLPNEFQLQRHIRHHDDGTIEKKRLKSNRIKIQRPDGRIVKYYKCPECDKLVHDIKRHRLVAHSMEEFQHACDECDKRFPTPSELRSHIRRVHRGEFPSLCAECGKGFNCRTALEDHERKHRGERPFVCDTCGRNFFSKVTLVCHLRTHDASNEVQCDVCGKRYPTRLNMQQHRKLHFEENRIFQCNFCERAFFKNSTLVYHVKLVHTMERPFVCATCGKGFIIKSKLEDHTQSHLGVKNYPCNFCSCAYYKKRNLKRHQLTAHKSLLRTWLCDECPKEYLAERSLIDHKIREHPSQVRAEEVPVEPLVVKEQIESFQLSNVVVERIPGLDDSEICNEQGTTFRMLY